MLCQLLAFGVHPSAWARAGGRVRGGIASPARPGLWRRVLPLGAVLIALVAPAGAQAHAFLISSSPAQGDRLAKSPAVMTLTFSEPVVAGSARITVRQADGQRITTPATILRGAVVSQRLPIGLRGIFVVTWQVLADDGHPTAGEFAFAAAATGRLPAVLSGTQSPTPPEQVAFSLLVFLGLALALGGVLSERVVFAPALAEVRGPPVGLGLGVALVGAVGELVLLAGQDAGGGFGAGLNPGRLGTAAGTRPGVLTVVLIGSLLVSAGLRGSRSRSWLAVGPLVAAVVSISLRSHAGTSGHAWAVAADALHLAGAAVWVGALAHLVLVGRSTTARARDPALSNVIRRYSTLALPTVLVIVWGGALDALAELRSLSDLVDTGWGRALLVKAGLVALALALALGSRLFALHGNPRISIGLLRRLTRGEVAVLLAVLVAAGVLVNAAPPRSLARATASATVSLGPPPVSGATLQLGDLAGLGTVVGVTVAPDQLRFRVVHLDGPAPLGTTLVGQAFGPGKTADLFPRPCGPGCFQIHYLLRPGATRLVVRVAIPNWPVGAATFDLPWPLPPADPALFARMLRAMGAVPAVNVTERVTSGPGANARPVAYRLSGESYINGEPYAGGAVDVRALDRRPPYRRLAFVLPGSDVWVTVTLDGRDRLRRQTVVSPGHLIEDSFAYPGG